MLFDISGFQYLDNNQAVSPLRHRLISIKNLLIFLIEILLYKLRHGDECFFRSSQILVLILYPNMYLRLCNITYHLLGRIIKQGRLELYK